MARNWAPEVAKQVNEIEWLWSIRAETYPNHGIYGAAYEVDLVTNERLGWNNAAEHEWALYILSWLKGDWPRLQWEILIYNDRLYYPGGDWVWYDWKGGPFGLNIEAVRRHGNHIHIRFPRSFYFAPNAAYP